MNGTGRPELPAFVIVGLVVVCATVLAAIDRRIPDWFPVIAGAGIGGGAGIAIPGRIGAAIGSVMDRGAVSTPPPTRTASGAGVADQAATGAGPSTTAAA